MPGADPAAVVGVGAVGALLAGALAAAGHPVPACGRAPLASITVQDRQAGRLLEHDGLLGPVVDGGIRHHIPTPASKAVLALLSALPAASPQGMP